MKENSFITTRSGINFYPFAPREEQIEIEDIAWALSHLCRYTGHTPIFYSVGHHSLLVADYLKEKYGPHAGYAGLLHDAAEAYINDLATPLKRHLTEFNEVEAGIMAAVIRKFKVDQLCLESCVSEGDSVLFLTEAKELMGNPQDWASIKKLHDQGLRPLEWKFREVSPAEVREKFLFKFHRYQEDLGL